MSNKDMPAYPVSDDPTHTPGLTKLEAFTMAALTGLCANGEMAAFGSSGVAKIAAEAAEAALAELEGRV